MIIIDLTYVQPLEVVNGHLAAHRKFLDKYYQAAQFLCSGAKEPRNGGVIIALCDSIEQAQAIVREDPFYIHQVASYKFTQFTATKYLPELEKYLV